MRLAIPILVAASLLATNAQACIPNEHRPLIAMHAMHPLLARGDDGEYIVDVDGTGCVVLTFPAYDPRAGKYAFRLAAEELKPLIREIEASGIARFEPATIRTDLASRDAAKRAAKAGGYYVRDEEILRFEIGSAPDGGRKATSRELVWTGLREQLLNHPDHGALLGLAALRDRLREIADDPRKRRIDE